MSKRFILTLYIFNVLAAGLMAQQSKKPLDYEVYDDWNYIEDQKISKDGGWILYEVYPYKGDGELILWNSKEETKDFFDRGKQGVFSPASSYMAYRIKPHHDSIRKMKLEKVPKKKRTKDSLGIFVLENGQSIKREKLKSFKLADKESDWMAFLQTKSEDEEDTLKKKEKPGKKVDEKAPEPGLLTIINPVSGKEYTFEEVTEYEISEDGSLVSFVKLQNDSLLKSTLFVFNTKKETSTPIFSQEGSSKNITIDHKGKQLAFLHSHDTTKNKVYSLFFWKSGKETPARIVDTLTASIPDKWTAGEFGKIYFSENDEKLFFGTKKRPTPEPKDTLLEEEKVKVDVWNWKDPLLQPQQLKNLEREKKRTYLAVYHIKDKSVVQLANKEIRNVTPVLKGNGDVAIGIDNQPYQ